MDMAIAAMSVDMSMAKAQQEVGVAALKMAMSAETSSVEEALAVVESLDPNLGNNLDITA
ncbi:MAG: YjfB family protein [Selenomonadaceae bacterium]|nr:YjfB family protein [Selenomonadaceae bacterium]MBQ6759674.1 YjfB family protein [Selenomonadaceae bacterium]MBR0102820.1 YjfB family protein [Selenomonadaceae bacterium]MBR6712530.1 YjfB family protein [Selenomonadaceae bacterium]